MIGYRITEADETCDGHPSYLVEPDKPSPLRPALFIVVKGLGLTYEAYRTEGAFFPHPPREAIRAAQRRYRADPHWQGTPDSDRSERTGETA